ncbi:unnamed protein product [Wuchereria bancrofti]|uniref:Uncharacterized protein n=2 Tax=Wuchereria bancrofti TaxID=6293 RepID=A0A183XKT3_WUCBA|nr:unnamed protein product [Wuchereria bancrofti]
MLESSFYEISSKNELMFVIAITSTTLAFMALMINLCTYGYIMLKVHRGMLLFREKTILAEQSLSRRRFADDLMGEMSKATHFDFASNQREINTLTHG